jgi:hypothetical protein
MIEREEVANDVVTRAEPHTCMPNYYLDHIAPRLAPTHQSVMTFLFRRIHGWHKSADSISLTQFSEGTGLSRSTVKRTLRSLELEGLVSRTQPNQPVGGHESTIYRITLPEAPKRFQAVPSGSSVNLDQGSEIPPSGFRDTPLRVQDDHRSGFNVNLDQGSGWAPQKKEKESKESKDDESLSSRTRGLTEERIETGRLIFSLDPWKRFGTKTAKQTVLRFLAESWTAETSADVVSITDSLIARGTTVQSIGYLLSALGKRSAERATVSPGTPEVEQETIDTPAPTGHALYDTLMASVFSNFLAGGGRDACVNDDVRAAQFVSEHDHRITVRINDRGGGYRREWLENAIVDSVRSRHAIRDGHLLDDCAVDIEWFSDDWALVS